MPTPHKRRSSGRVIVSSPLGSGRRRSGRLSIISKPAKTSNVKVCIRIRPLSEKERGFHEGKEVVDVTDERMLVFDPVEVHAPSFHRGRPTRDPTIRRNRDLTFTFGRVFGPEATNEDIFEETTRETLDNLMKGINCSVFAYGATGAGKTFTMLGTPTNKGVIARTVHELYERIDAISENVICDVEVSYLEIYNEMIRDLLNPTDKEIVVQEGAGGKVVIKGLTFHTPTDMDDLFRMLEVGNNNRTQHPTDANKESSRSHAVFHIYLKQRSRIADVATDVTMSKMALIDLAGSERAAATANCGVRFREGANINKSLLALGNCINALADGKATNFIPFRQSKLTRILKDSLGGNCQTVMVAAVSSSKMSYDDTYNTLKYADRAQKIKTDLKTNVYRVEHSTHEYSKIVEQQQNEIQTLNQKVETLELEKRRLQRDLNTVRQNAFTSELAREQGSGGGGLPLTAQQLEQMNDVIRRYTELQNRILDVESQRSLLQLKISHKERSQRQLDEVLDAGKKEAARGRFEEFRMNSQFQLTRLAEQIINLDDGLRQMKTIGDEIFESVGASCRNGHHEGYGTSDGREIKMVIDAMKDRSDMCQAKAHERHLNHVVDCMSSRIEQQDKVIEAMGSLLKEQYLLLSSYNHVSSSMISRFENVEKLLRGKQGVTWGDQNGHSGGTSGLLELRNCTIRKFGCSDASFDVKHPVNGLAALVANGAGIAGTSAATVQSDQFSSGDYRDLPRQHLRFEHGFVDTANGAAAYSDTDEEVQMEIGTPPNRHPSVMPKGTPIRRIVCSSKDEAEDDDWGKLDERDRTFTQIQPHENGHKAAGDVAFTSVSTKTANGASGGGGDERARPNFGHVPPKFSDAGPDYGRPSLPAWKITPKVPPRGQEVDAEGFKKPPIPERLNRPKMPVDKSGDGGVLTRKPSATSVTSIRSSPMTRSPSQNSLTNPKKTPDTSTGAGSAKGLKRVATSSTNLRWKF